MKNKRNDPACGLNLRNMPPALHALFKSECVRRGRTMTGLVTAFMTDSCKPAIEQAKPNYFSTLSRKYPLPR